MSANLWDNPSIVSFLLSYVQGKMTSIEELQDKVSGIIGAKVPLCVLNSKLEKLASFIIE